MKKITLAFVFLAIVFSTLSAQEKPDWLDESVRSMKFPATVFYTGFSYGDLAPNRSLQEVTQQMKTEAQADAVRKIRVRINATSQSSIATLSANGKYSETESFTNQSTTQADAEIAGIKSETYFDSKANRVYAFAYVNRYELIGYYKSNLSLNINQIEGFLQTAQDLEAQHEKAKARQQCEAAQPLFDKIRYAQDMLTALDSDVSAYDLQQDKTTELYNRATQLLAQLAQGIYVYVESRENLFGAAVDITSSKLKAELAVSGCSFTDHAEEADFYLKLRTSVRKSDSSNGLEFCYADASVELYDTHKQKVVYSDEIAQKGGSNTLDKAGRKALSDVASKIAEKLKNWIQ